jgi:hypothetical protein
VTDRLLPLLFLDVDGTVLPLGGPPPETWDGWEEPSNPLLATIVRGHGGRLLALGCELRWATAWMHGANVVIAPLLGLPQLPVVDLPDAPEEDRPGVLHWTTRPLVETAAGRPFVWIDDEMGELDRVWVSAHHPGPALLHRVDSVAGLTGADLDAVERWLRAVGGR